MSSDPIFTRNLQKNTTAAGWRSDLGLALGSDVQPYNALLAAVAALSPMAADRYVYTTGSDAVAAGTITAFARTILDDADEATFKATVNLEIGTDIQAQDAVLEDLSGLADITDLFNAGGVYRINQDTTNSPGVGNGTLGGTLNADAAALLLSRNDTMLFLNRNNDGNVADFRFQGGSVGSISINSTNTAFNTSSDRTHKENISDMDLDAAHARIASIQLHEFRWKADGSDGRGVLADELQQVIPEAVTGEPGSMQWDASKCVPDMLGAMQWMMGRIADLEKRVADLEGLSRS